MYLKMLDFFLGTGKEFTLEAMEISKKLTQESGEFVFREGDSADHFFVLLKGRIRLTVGQTGSEVYVVRNKGEIFGWSCLIGRETYSASAEGLEPTDLLRFDRESFLRILERYPANEALIYRRIAETLGNRLLELYPTIS